MNVQIRMILVSGTALLGISLLIVIQYLSGTSHFSIIDGLLVPFVGIILSLSMMGKSIWLVGMTFLEGRILKTCDQRIQREP